MGKDKEITKTATYHCGGINNGHFINVEKTPNENGEVPDYHPCRIPGHPGMASLIIDVRKAKTPILKDGQFD